MTEFWNPQRRLLIYFTVTNGTAEPGTIVVGSTPFQRSACTSVTKDRIDTERVGAGMGIY